MRILHLIKSLGRGGAEMLLPETLALHDRNKFEFTYAYFLPHKNQLVSALTAQGVAVHCFGKSSALGMLSAVNAVALHAKRLKADVIHCHLPWAGIVGRIAGRRARIPVIYTEHNKQERYHYLTRKFNLLTLPWNSETIAVSDDVSDSIHKFKGAEFSVKVVRNGVNTEKFERQPFMTNGMGPSVGIPPGALVIGTVAVFRKQKRLDAWLDLAAKVLREHPDTHFVIVGDGPLENEVRRKISELGLEGKVHLPGRLEEVRPWLASMDIFLMTSSFEGLPIALLEAMSMQLPVVTTDAGGIREVVRNGIEGFIQPVDNPGKLFQPLLDLCVDRPLRDEVGKAARLRVVENFSMTRMVTNLEQIYQQVRHDAQTRK